MIKTKPFRLTPKMYFKIVVMRQLRRSWWLHTLVLCYAVYLLNMEEGRRSTVVLAIVGFAYLPACIVYYYFWATSSENNMLFEKREMTAYEDKLTMSAGESSSNLSYSSIRHIVETPEFLLLYIAKSMFVYVPKNAFANSDDLDAFRKYLERRS
jgi:YcxB-like protein